jgi:hypothetical protein
MKWIKSRTLFLSEEAKIRDVILPRQAVEVAKVWGEKWLDLEEADPTDKIKQGKWKISEEDKIEILGEFFMCDLKSVYKFFNSLPDKLNEVLKLSVKPENIKDEKLSKIMESFDIQKPSVDQICVLTEAVFRKISVSETTAAEIMIRDENGRPVMGEDGRPTKRKKEEGEIIFTNNLCNINTFISDFNRLFPTDQVESDKFSGGNIQTLISTASDTVNSEYRVDYNLFSKDMYLSIKHNPKDILNMSVSKYYASCQHLYTGGYRRQLLANVFDINSIPAFILFDTPIMWGDDTISENLPLCRMQIRNIEGFTEDRKEPKIFFDRAYPDRMKNIMGTIIEKYSENKETEKDPGGYLFTPDIPEDYEISSKPYMDRLSLRQGTLIGKNTKKIHLINTVNWSDTIISPNAKIEEVIIETPDIPKNFLDLKLNLKWIKFKFIKLNTLSVFESIKSKSFSFDKCKFDNQILVEIKKSNPDIEKISLIACEVKGLDLSIFEELEELHLVYTLEDLKLSDVMMGLNLNKLIISTDIMTDSDNKKFISEMKRKGIKVETTGPKI